MEVPAREVSARWAHFENFPKELCPWGKARTYKKMTFEIVFFLFRVAKNPINCYSLLFAIPTKGFHMKKDIHPKYEEATITCACGNVIKTRSTVKAMHVNTCSACHPYFTGQQTLVDTEGRIDRFRKRYGLKK